MSVPSFCRAVSSGTGLPKIPLQNRVLMAMGIGLAILLCSCGGRERPGESCDVVERTPKMWPDYDGVVLPPNIAPLNFAVEEPGMGYFVRIHGAQGKPVEVRSGRREIRIPQRPWRQLLESNRGGALSLDVFVKSGPTAQTGDGAGPWQRFARVDFTIANEGIDRFIVYRKIWPGHSFWGQMGVYQRDLESYDERTILDNGSFRQGCVNCHTLCNHRADRMLLGIRSTTYGSSAILVHDGQVDKIGTKLGYASWHPSGALIAFSINRVRQLFHSAANEVRDVVDYDSLIVYYRVGDTMVRTAPPLARIDWLETYPTWSPDGRYLYFCCAPITWKDRHSMPKEFDQIKYSLVRVPYDVETDHWGEGEPVLSADQTGQSILLPRLSPDGRWLLFTMCDYGCFPVYRQSGDLYLMDLESGRQTGQYRYHRLGINSDASESWHSWSSNGRWIAFSSKRLSHSFTRTYLAYVDEYGTAHQPFLLPQEDPRFYDSCLWTFSVPELATEHVPVRTAKIARAVRAAERISVQMPVTMATPAASASSVQDESWHQSGSR